MRAVLKALRADRAGATVVEYGLLVALIGLSMSFALSRVGVGLHAVYNAVNNATTNAQTNGGG